MKPVVFIFLVMVCFCRCSKPADNEDSDMPVTSSQFTKYTIRQGEHYCDNNPYTPTELTEMKFVVRFDSTAIYQTSSPQNQDDINKLFGFADNEAEHHEYSARFGWRWSNHALRLFAYVYNEGIRTSKELSLIAINSDMYCSIKVDSSRYVFNLDGRSWEMPRSIPKEKAKGYQLYPYFGGDETAPHEINILMRRMN